MARKSLPAILVFRVRVCGARGAVVLALRVRQGNQERQLFAQRTEFTGRCPNRIRRSHRRRGRVGLFHIYLTLSFVWFSRFPAALKNFSVAVVAKYQTMSCGKRLV